MQIKNRFIKIFFKLFILIALFECVYLFAVPVTVNKFLQTNYFKNHINSNSNLHITYKSPVFKTHILPFVSLHLDELKINNNSEDVISAHNIDLKLSLLKLFIKKINFQNINADNINIIVIRDKNGSFNFNKIFKKTDNSTFKFSYKNLKSDIKNYQITCNDNKYNKTVNINGNNLNFIEKNKKLSIKTTGDIISGNKKSSYDINLLTKYPIKKEELNKTVIKGNCFIYDIDTEIFLPYLQIIFPDKNIKTLKGMIEYLQISAYENDKNTNNIVINTKFKDILFDKTDWKNNIQAKGENQLSLDAELTPDLIIINSFGYEAENIDIKALGEISLSKKPKLNLNIKVKDSKAENIASLLPPTLVPQYMTIEKIKTYGVYGDIEGEVNVNGEIPQPDITGYVKGRNIHVLDKSIHKLHKGTVDITFNKRILNMNITVDMFNKQRADIKGYVYMFRDGINNVSIKTTKNIDFPLAQKIVVPISKVFNFQLGPIPEMNIKSGKGVIDVNIKGSIDFVNIFGYSAFNNVRLTYNGLFGEIYKGKGRLDFKDDIVSFKSERAYVKNNSLDVSGKVKINDNLDFNIRSNNANAVDIIEIINKSELLKDVKAGIAVITEASGPVNLFVNMKAKIVPVPFGQPPLPPEEAFEDMKVTGYIDLINNTCFLQGFYTPVEYLKGKTDFTETTVNLNNIEGYSGTSKININGKIITDIKTKIPDIDITVTSDSVNLKDTIKFLTQSYLYPNNYPDLSSFYNIASKHDLYFKYKAKSIDFITNKAYAVMNFIKDDTQDILKSEHGKITMENSEVKIEDVKANLYDSIISVSGNVKRIDTLNPLYNLKISSDNFNFAKLNSIEQSDLINENIKDIFSNFIEFKGFADIDINLVKNVLNGEIKFSQFGFKESKTKIPINFDDFKVEMHNNKIKIDNMTALISDMPLFADIEISDINKNPKINGYFTSKITDNFIKNYLPKSISDKLTIIGDVNLSSYITGTKDNFNIQPKLSLHKEADILFNGTNIGEISDEREFIGNINIKDKFINVVKMEYIKYITSQNNKIYPILFATMNGKFNIDENNIIIADEVSLKTDKNLSARLLNLIIGSPIFKQGALNCDLKYTFDKITKSVKILGSLNCRNIDIPLFDTIVKHIQINADDKDIKLNVFGFITDGKITIDSSIENNISKVPKIKFLNIYADQIDNNKLLEEFYKTRQAINTNKQTGNIQLPELKIETGSLEIKKINIKSLVANNFKSNFSINEEGIFSADDINVEVGQGNISGNMFFDLNNTNLEGVFELKDVDSNYVAETLFEGEDQIFGKANGKVILSTKGLKHDEIIENLSGFIYFDIVDGKMPKLGSLEYLLRASNIIKSGLTGLTLNSILEILNLVKTGYFSDINGSCSIENGVAKNIQIFSTGENLSLYIKGEYDIAHTHANMEILGKLSKRISTIFGAIGNTSLNTFFKLIPGISFLDFGRKDIIEDVEKIPSFTHGEYDSRTFQAIINGNINNKTGYVQSFKWVKQ